MPKLSRSELANLAVGLPIVTAIIGVLVGIGLGVGLGWILKPGAPTVDPASRITLDAFSADQIQFKCGQIRGEELKSANERISALERERDEYEKRVLALEAKVEDQKVRKGSGGGSRGGDGAATAALEGEVLALTRELNEARDHLGDVTRQLFQAEEDKRQLQEALVATSSRLREAEAELEVQTTRAEAATEDAMGQKWWRFLADSQLEICEKGNRKKMGACRETVQAHLKSTAVRDRFAHCVRSEQATPAVRLLERETELPRFAQYIDQDDRIVKDWYVQMCDPTLPEAPGFGDRPNALSRSPLNPSESAFGLQDLDN